MTVKKRSHFLIAAPTSGSGKTTICRGLMELFTAEGYRVQPFKCGPDYIDTKYHEQACGRPSINLDTFMATQPHVSDLFRRHSAEADVSVVEGMMGLFDGYDRQKGSSAEIAVLLDIPVVLVVDAKSSAYSTAALISGFRDFNPKLCLVGVIFNKVGGQKHARLLKEVCDDLNLHYLGALFRNPDLNMDSRYLGLDFQESSPHQLKTFADAVRRDLLWEKLLEVTGVSSVLEEEISEGSEKKPFCEPEGSIQSPLDSPTLSDSKVLSDLPALSDLETVAGHHIAVARNAESFSFIYAEHLDVLSRLGQVSFFDPEVDVELPEAIDLLYLPGGYPEKQAERLSQNHSLMEAIRRYTKGGGRVIAECGGMIYLSQGIKTSEKTFPMVGLFPFTIDHTPEERKLTLGYRQFDYHGLKLSGHEFHYTQIVKEDAKCCPTIVQVRNAKGEPVDTGLFRVQNVIASYTHLYWGEMDLFKLF